MPRLVIPLICVSLLGVSCAGPQPSNEEQVKTSVRTFLASLGKDGTKACSALTEEAQTALVTFAEKTPCEKAAGSIRDAGPVLRYFEDNFEGVRFRGTDNQVAEVDVRPAASFAPLQPIPLVQTGDGWKISEFGWYYR